MRMSRRHWASLIIHLTLMVQLVNVILLIFNGLVLRKI